jgi:hypothetical protein
MLLFRDEEHLDRWCAVREMPRGAVLTPDQAWRLARGWYADKVKPAWRRHTLEEAEALFASVELTSDFWSLRG